MPAKAGQTARLTRPPPNEPYHVPIVGTEQNIIFPLNNFAQFPATAPARCEDSRTVQLLAI